MDRAEFASPGTGYRGVTLWMLNDVLERDEIARQLEGIHEAGWGAVIGRTFSGLLTQYLSDEWMDIIQEIIDGARDKGMRVWLQAGYMPSGMPGLSDDEKYRVLARKDKDEGPGEGETLLCTSEDHAFYTRMHGTVLDLLNPEAVYAYLDKAYKEPWGDRFGDEFGKTVEAIWVDEPHFRPPLLPWSDRLPARFEEQWGYSIVDHVPSLFARTGDWNKVRHHYWRIVLDMFLEAYFEQVGRWCDEHGVKFSGHLMGEDSLNGQIGWTASAMPGYTHMQLPGIDHLTGNMTWPTGRSFILTPKQCSSAANQLGRTERLAEMYGVSGQGLTFEHRKWIGDWIMSLGINYRCYHGSFYSMRGRRKRVYAPHLSYQQPWWTENRPIADYFARLSYALRQGQYRADVLVIHPVESAWCVYEPTQGTGVHDRVNEPTDIKTMNDAFASIGENLLKIQRGFEYGDEYLMARHGKVTEDGLVVGEMAYRTVILPPVITLRQTTVDLLNEFIGAGGAVLATGDLPTRIDGDESPAIDALNARVARIEDTPAGLREALDAAAPATVQVVAVEGDATDVWVHERQLDGRRLFFLTNSTRDASVEADVRIRGRGRLEHWNLETGKVDDVPQKRDGDFIVTRVVLPPAGSRLLALDEKAQPRDVPALRAALAATRSLEGPYAVRRLSPNAMVLDSCRFRKGTGRWSKQVPLILVQEDLQAEGYEGPLRLQFRFVADARPESIQLVIEDAAEYAVTVNGSEVAYDGLPYYVDRSFHPIDITDHVQAGENVIELSREFQPVQRASFSLASLFEARRGVELESVYLTGDFAVKARLAADYEKGGCTCLEPDMVLAEEHGTASGDLAMEGYPFFVGRVVLSKAAELNAPTEGQQAFLTLPDLGAALAKVRVNGHEAGTICWQPRRVEVTPFLRDGRNEFEIELVTTLRNLMGPHHRQSDEYNTWGHSWSPRWPTGAGWFEKRNDEDVDWTDSYVVSPLGLRDRAEIQYVSPE